MKFLSPFILLLGSIFSLSIHVNAIPLTPRQKGIITLPLKRLQSQQDLHPQLLLQQHINRSHRRLARMTGREGPSDEVLLEMLVSREAHIRHGRHRVDEADAQTGTGFSAIDLKAAEEKSVTPGNQPTAPNSLSLSIEQNDVGYAATISMGSPPQEFSILMDSGSADFWVTGEKCQSSSVKGANCGNHTTLGPSSSSSFVDTRQIFQVLYGSGNVSGTKIIDDISIAGLSLPQHSFGATQKESFQFTGATFDGLMGVAQSTLSQQKVPTPVESLFTSGLIQEAIISFKISRLRDALNDGDVTFGGLDPNKFDQNTLVTLDNVNPQGFWEANFSSVTMNGKRLKVTGLSAILDTGTTLMVVPQDDALTIHQRIQGAKSDGKGGFTVPCTTNASLALTFGGQTFAIESTDLAFLPVDPNDLQGDCQSGITPSSINGLSTWLVGDVFLKNAYLSVNTNENTISLAKLT